MHKREWAQALFHILVFLASIAFLVAGGLGTASAQEVSPTPGPGLPDGTQTIIPEIPTQSPINITYPVHGLKLIGDVQVSGNIALEGWTTYELAFSYADGRDDNWFVFAGGSNPPAGNALGVWKTATIGDEDYNLRLRVFFPDGSSQDGFVYGLRVRNYITDTPIPTLTFTPTLTPVATDLPTLTPTLTLTIFPTPTALPPNPAILDQRTIALNLGQGALVAFVLFGVFGVLLRLRRR